MEIKPKPLRTQRELVGPLIDEYYDEIKHAPENGQPIVVTSGLAPFEILRAGGFIPLCAENLVASAAAKKLVPDLCRVAEVKGLPRTLCTYCRVDLGSMWAEEKTLSPHGQLPKPAFLMSPSVGCNVYNMWFENIARFYKVPMQVVETPFLHDNPTKEDFDVAVSYVMKQVRELISFMEDYTKKPFDWDKLAESTAYTREMARLYLEAMNLMKNLPAPAGFNDIVIHLFGMVCLRGSAEGPRFYKMLKEELSARVAQGFSPLPEEKHRLYWDTIFCWSRIRDLFVKFGSYGANLVVGQYPMDITMPCATLDPERPLESWAEMIVTNVLNQGQDYKVDLIEKLVTGWKCDGMIMHYDVTCKTLFMGQYDMAKELERRTGIPYVIVQGDIGDPRLYDSGRMDDRIDSFMEILEKKPTLSR